MHFDYQRSLSRCITCHRCLHSTVTCGLNTFYNYLNWIFEDLLPCYCYTIETNDKSVASFATCLWLLCSVCHTGKKLSQKARRGKLITTNSLRAAKVYFVVVWKKFCKDKLSEVELLQHFLRLRNLSRVVCCEGLTCRKASCRVWTKLLPWKKISLPRCLKLAAIYILSCKARVHRLTKKILCMKQKLKKCQHLNVIARKILTIFLLSFKIYLPALAHLILKNFPVSRYWEEHLFILFRPLRKISNSHLVPQSM